MTTFISDLQTPPPASLIGYSIEESFVEFECKPFDTYENIDCFCSLSAGAAIWILDHLKMNGNLHKAYEFMPSAVMDIYDADIPFGFIHPLYEFELILSVSHMILSRNGGRNITDEGRRNENFDRLLALIESDRLDHACQVFEEKQWDIIGRAMKLAGFFDGEERKLLNMIRNNLDPSPLLVMQKPELRKNEANKLVDRLDDIYKQRRWIEVKFAEHLNMSRKEMTKAVGNRYGADILQGFTVDDPYEMCMALILLLDNGSDAPWLMQSGTTLMRYTAGMLPWYPFYDDEDYEEDTFYNPDNDCFNRNDWVNQPSGPVMNDPYHTRFGRKNLAQIVFDMSNGILPFNMHPFTKERKELIEKGLDAAAADKVESLSELFFFNDYQSAAANLMSSWLHDRDNDDFRKETKRDNSEKSPEETGIETAATESEADIAAELEKAKKEIKNLRKALSEVSREANADKIKYERELKVLRREHRELADLRELVFSREHADQEEDTGTSINFPYNVRKRTVVFGGHDSFLKNLRQMIPDAKYIDVDNYTFSPEIVRNADIVWVQNNCISHSQYGKILTITRQHGIQLRYFTYASAEKSARQLAEEDQKP